MTWITAWLRGLAIVGYFVVATVWVPDFLLNLSFLQTANDVLSDLILLAVWGAALVGGMWALRVGQRKGII